MKPDLIVIGHILNETIKLPDRTIAPVLGSPTAYCSVIASRLGVKTGVVTKIGIYPESCLRSSGRQMWIPMVQN